MNYFAFEVLTFPTFRDTISTGGCVIAPLTHLSFSRTGDLFICSAVLFCYESEYIICILIIYEMRFFASVTGKIIREIEREFSKFN